MIRETLPTVHQADLAQASGLDVLRGFTEAGVAELVNALHAYSVGAQEASQSSGLHDKELTGVSKPSDRFWPSYPYARYRRGAGLNMVRGGGLARNRLLQDSHDELIARVNKTYVVEDPSDNELTMGRTLRGREQGWDGGEGVDAAIIVRRTFVLFWPSGPFSPII